MQKDELKGKTIDVFSTQLILQTDTNAYLKTILEILVETNKLDKEAVQEKFIQNREYFHKAMVDMQND
jgi:hypothetical protein